MAPNSLPAFRRCSSPRILAAATIFMEEVILAMLVVDAIFMRSCFSDAMPRACLGAERAEARTIMDADILAGWRVWSARKRNPNVTRRGELSKVAPTNRGPPALVGKGLECVCCRGSRAAPRLHHHTTNTTQHDAPSRR
jgi:hypothetical protein